MPRLLQISIEVNVNSVGKIAEQLGEMAISRGWESYITYCRNGCRPSKSHTIRIGNWFDVFWHGIMTRLFDRHCLHSTRATKKLITQIKEINPDIIHLHHIHGYFIDMRILCDYLKTSGIPVVWTFHDCWSFTGHCCYFDLKGFLCNKWETQCCNCPLKSEYPKSFIDRSYKNFLLKKQLFTSIPDLRIVTVSKWLEKLTRKSFFSNNDIRTIYNGVDTDVFRPYRTKELIQSLGLCNKKILLAAATTWDSRKGFDDYVALASILPSDIVIILVGLKGKQQDTLPSNIYAFPKTSSARELAEYYSMADIVLNLSYAETFGLTTAEGMSCGTPGIVYNATASPELIDSSTGFVVEPGNIRDVAKAVTIILENGKDYYSENCRRRVEKYFDKNSQYDNYFKLYEELLEKQLHQRKPPVLSF